VTAPHDPAAAAAEIKALVETAAVTYSLSREQRQKELKGGPRASAEESNRAMGAAHAAIDAQAAAAQALQAEVARLTVQLAKTRGYAR